MEAGGGTGVRPGVAALFRIAGVLAALYVFVSVLAWKYQERLADQRGHLCLFVPARQEIYAPLDKDFGHYRRYGRTELRRKVEQTGFTVVRLHYFNWIGYFAWWFNFCLLKKRRFDVNSVVVFDRIIFPLVHALERNFARPPFGQSLLAIAQASKT